MTQITYYGHACFEIECNGKSMLFDPFIRGNALASHVELSSINPHYILLSHAHSDHTADAVEISKQSGATCIGVYEVCGYLQSKGAESIHPMNIGGSKVFDGIEIKMTQAIHSSSFEDGTYGGVAGGFQISTDNCHFYYAGDTSFFGDMQFIGKKRQLDFAILPIGGNFTMDATDAIECAKLLNVNKVIGVHYDTFGYIVINHQNAIDAFSEAGIELILMPIGGKYII
jgi:L-ascorbate metabolism protein UlaG (beta-lactamase superfamily)